MNGDNVADSDDPYYMANQFQPRTMKVSESLAFFVRFVAHTIMEKRAQNSKGRDNRRRLRDRLKQVVAFPRKSMKYLSDETLTTATAVSSSSSTTTPTTTTKNRLGKWHKLNDSRKSLIRLVGYDSSMMTPAFGYLIIGAFMTSVVPYYYSSCISCIASADPNRRKLLVAMMAPMMR